MHLAHWSIAQTKNRETKASGIGWELFLNYRIARDKYKPDYFLYENNKSMSPAIRTQITAELGVEPVLINSALLSPPISSLTMQNHLLRIPKFISAGRFITAFPLANANDRRRVYPQCYSSLFYAAPQVNWLPVHR